MRNIRMLLIGCVAIATRLTAASVSFDALGGSIFAPPGEVTGWGFTVVNDSPAGWISFTGSVLVNETSPLLGVYSDLIGPQGGPVDFSVQPQSIWEEAYSHAAATGLGEYQIAAGLPIGAVDTGFIRVFWDEYAGDPLTCDCSAESFSQDLPFQVTIASDGDAPAAPEPGTGWWIGGLLTIAAWRYRRRLA